MKNNFTSIKHTCTRHYVNKPLEDYIQPSKRNRCSNYDITKSGTDGYRNFTKKDAEKWRNRVRNITRSICENGFYPTESIKVFHCLDTQKYVIVDGASRWEAIKIILNNKENRVPGYNVNIEYDVDFYDCDTYETSVDYMRHINEKRVNWSKIDCIEAEGLRNPKIDQFNKLRCYYQNNGNTLGLTDLTIMEALTVQGITKSSTKFPTIDDVYEHYEKFMGFLTELGKKISDKKVKKIIKEREMVRQLKVILNDAIKYNKNNKIFESDDTMIKLLFEKTIKFFEKSKAENLTPLTDQNSEAEYKRNWLLRRICTKRGPLSVLINH